MSTSNGERQESSGNAEFSHETGIGALAGILQGIQTTLADLSASSKAQTAAFQSIQEDILLRDADDEDDTAHSTVDPTCVVSALLDSSEATVSNNPKAIPERSDPEQQSDLLDSLTQAFLSSDKKSPPVSTKIADLIDSVLSGKLSTDTAKERGEKYLPPENCGRLCSVTVNEEIWDLLPRRGRSVDLAFQRVQEALIPGLSSLAMLADKLANDAKNGKTIDTAEILHHVIDSLVLVSQANWSLNMRREQIKPDIASPYSRLCKPDIAPTTKLFGDDLPKQLKEMTDVTRVGRQLQKKTADQKPNYQKPYDRSRPSFNKKHPNRKPFLGYGRTVPQTGGPHKRNQNSQ